MADREDLIMQLYKESFGKNFNKYDISVRYDSKDGSLHMNEHREGEEHFTKAQIDSAMKYFKDNIEKFKTSGLEASRKKVYEISVAAISLMTQPQEDKK
jgi:hypothetical protein